MLVPNVFRLKPETHTRMFFVVFFFFNLPMVNHLMEIIWLRGFSLQQESPERLQSIATNVVRCCIHNFSNALANITRLLIGQRQEFVTVYFVMYRRRSDVMSNVAVGWLMS